MPPPLSRFMTLSENAAYLIWGGPSGAVGIRKTVGLVLSTILLLLSLFRFTVEGGLTTEVWGYLLLSPLPVAMAIAPENRSPPAVTEGGVDWDESDAEGSASKVPDPIEAGFDVPIL